MKEGNLKKNKRAISHIEVIISFVIFVSFVGFLLIIFNPIKMGSPKIYFLDVTENEIMNKVSTFLYKTAIKVDTEAIANFGESEEFNDAVCVKISKDEVIADVELLNNPIPLLVKNIGLNILQTKTPGSSDKIFFTKSDESEQFYRFYYSKELLERNNDDLDDCYNLDNKEKYKKAETVKYEVASYKKLEALFGNYSTNYTQLRQSLNLNNHFYIQLTNTQGEIIFKPEEKYALTGIEVYARGIPIEVLDKDGNINPYILTIQAWG